MIDNEKKMVRKIVKGDEKSFALFDMYQGKVIYRIALVLMKNPEDAGMLPRRSSLKSIEGLEDFTLNAVWRLGFIPSVPVHVWTRCVKIKRMFQRNCKKQFKTIRLVNRKIFFCWMN